MGCLILDIIHNKMYKGKHTYVSMKSSYIKRKGTLMASINKPDMGSGSIPKLLAHLAIPTVLSQIVNLLYNVVDRIYIGHIPEVGSTALTGVGLFTPILMLITAFAMLVSSGGTPRAAIAMGQKKSEAAEKILGNSITMVLIFSVGIVAVFYPAAPTLLRLFGASTQTLPYAVPYARIYILGTIFVMISLGLNPFITAQGFAKTSMYTTLIGAVINIILDPVFIFCFNLGTVGAALATVISQAISAIWVVRFLTGRRTVLKLKKSNLKLERSVILPCLALGISSFVMTSTESLLSMTFSANLARYGGDLAVGAMTIIQSVAQFVTMPVQGLCQGAQPIISFNYGAGNKSRVKSTFRLALTIAVGYTTLCCIATIFAPQIFVRLFTSKESLLAYTSWALRVYMAGIFAIGFQLMCQFSFVALGQAKTSLIMACLRKLILLIPLIYILPHFFANKEFAVFLAEPVSDIIAAIVTTSTFLARINRILDSHI